MWKLTISLDQMNGQFMETDSSLSTFVEYSFTPCENELLWLFDRKRQRPIPKKEVYLGLLDREFSREKKGRVDSQMESKQY